MVRDEQHVFDKAYRDAHDTQYISVATIKELSLVVHELCEEFISTIQAAMVDNYEVSLKRFKAYGQLLESMLSDDNIEKREELHLNISILTGSLLEGVLQFFLLAYNNDFIKSKWKQWEDVDIVEIQNEMENVLKSLVSNKQLNEHQKGNLISVINKELSIRKDGKMIPTIMLDELIGFCKNQKIFLAEHEDDFQDRMNSIRGYRNNIHIFVKSDYPLLEEAITNVRSLCLIMNELITRIDGKVHDNIG